jgi:hypothetical protein
VTHGRYLVSGRRRYRGHQPGSIFEAQLDPAVEQRAVSRGDIALLERVTPGIEPGSYKLPDDWPPRPVGQSTEAPQGASLT